MTRYFGSKAVSGLYQNIIAMMPPHDTCIETHLGGGAVMRNKPPARNNIAIDIDPKPLEPFDCDYLVQKVNAYAHRYRHQYSRQDHLQLLDPLQSLPCRVILSGYPSALYDGMLQDWNWVELQAMTWGDPWTEKLWYNYDIDHTRWAIYARKDFTDRQRIKRKAERWQGITRRYPPRNGSPCWRRSWRWKRWRRINEVTAPVVKGNGQPGPDQAQLEKLSEAKLEDTRIRLEEKDRQITELSEQLAKLQGEIDNGCTRGFLVLFRAYNNLRTRRWGPRKDTSDHQYLAGQPVVYRITTLGFAAVSSKPQKTIGTLAYPSGSKTCSEATIGGVCVNDVVMHLAVPGLPFGGVGSICTVTYRRTPGPGL